MQNGKGSARRPASVSKETWEANYDRTFGNKPMVEEAQVYVRTSKGHLVGYGPLSSLKIRTDPLPADIPMIDEE